MIMKRLLKIFILAVIACVFTITSYAYNEFTGEIQSSTYSGMVSVYGKLDSSYAGKTVNMLLLEGDGSNYADEKIVYIDSTFVDDNGLYSFKYECDEIKSDAADGNVDEHTLYVSIDGEAVTESIMTADITGEEQTIINIDLFANKTTVKATADVFNLYNNDISAVFMLAAYNEDGKLIKVSDAKAVSSTDDTVWETALNEIEEAETVKAFIWKSMSSPIPLCGVKNYTFENAENATIYIAGDSIAQTYGSSDYPQKGYGQVFEKFFDDSITVKNYGIGGRSSKSFITEGRLDKILAQINSGDYLIVQFGHNDTKDEINTDPYASIQTEDSYKWYLKQYADSARDKGAIPVFVTPPQRLIISTTDQKIISDGNLDPYVTAMKDVAKTLGVYCIDLNKKWADFLSKVPNAEYAKNYYMFVESIDDARYKDDEEFKASKYFTNPTEYIPNKDGTHLNTYSAEIVAGMIASGLAQSYLPISRCVNEYTPECPWMDMQY